jgi:shikimate dehydrogenase
MKGWQVSGTTQMCGLIGDPVAHSVSPAIQNAAFGELKLDYAYVPFRVEASSLGEAVRGIRALNLRGINVTIPHKVAIIPYLDELDGLARDLGSVNTVVNQNGYLKGYNTDAAGFLMALAVEKVSPRGKKIVLLGAGGAARAIAFVLADRGAHLTILNRHAQAAQELAGRIFGTFRREVGGLELNPDNLKKSLAEAEMIVNTTSFGMNPETGLSPVPGRLLRKDLITFDIIYNPAKTRLLVEAEKKGAQIIGGIEMLVQQGSAAFELWTGQRAPLEVMRRAALEALGDNED